MIAYFALLSFVPLTFLALSLLGLSGRADESSFLVKEIKHTLPGTPIDRILALVHTVQDNAAALGSSAPPRSYGRRSRSSACSSRRSTSSTAARTVRSCTARRLRRS
jgi:hypothetical protein